MTALATGSGRASAGPPPARTRLASLLALLALFLVSAGLTACSGGDEPATTQSPGVVRVAGGLVSGTEADGVRAYLGIPYAAPPVGDLRWRPPQAPAPWDGVRTCVRYGPSCPQPQGDGLSFFPLGETDEDCLYLNVWTPDGTADGAPKLPVMVWIHGGGFSTGSGSLDVYSGVNLARLGAVVITVNYRLGPLGFLAHPGLSGEDPAGASGNYGLLDQIAALEWVRENVAAFGGDPENVTVFGESAGGMSICDLMVSPPAEGLFARAIVQSGPFDSSGAGMDAVRPLAEAEETGRELSRRLGCDEAPDELAALRAVPVGRLLRAAERTVPRGPGGLGFVPVIDGVVLPGDPAALFAAGELHDVDLLVGANADEANLFLLGMRGATAAQLTTYVRRLYEPDDDAVLELFPDDEHGSRKAALSKAVTVMGFIAPARFAAASVAETGAAAYLYHFVRVPPAVGDLGAFHGLEIPYVFGNPVLVLDVTGGVDGELSRAMMRYWVSFARDGDPNAASGTGEQSDAALPSWPAYDPATDRCLILDAEIEAAPAP
ncbi:MAG: carboxylesterase family protein, partial [Actinomycetota bacterium]